MSIDALREAFKSSDADRILNLYADDATITVVDKLHAPGEPFTLKGKPAIAEFGRDICAREMTHKIESDVMSGGRAALVEACEYPDGCRVMAAMMFALVDGKIARQLTVQAWDDTPRPSA